MNISVCIYVYIYIYTYDIKDHMMFSRLLAWITRNQSTKRFRHRAGSEAMNFAMSVSPVEKKDERRCHF